MHMNVNMNALRENPTKILLGSAGSVIAVVTALFAVDARYAHAADVEQAKTNIQRSIESSTMTIRQQMIEDKLFELDLKKAQTPRKELAPIDAALKQRYERQLNELTRQQSLQKQQ